MRFTTSTLLSLAFVAPLWLTSCTPPNLPAVDAGVTPEDDGGAPDGPPAADEYCERIEPFFCDFYLRCGRMAGVTTVDECRAVFREQCNARYEPRYLGLVNAGLLELSADGIDACRAHLEDVACEEQIRDLDGACGAMWVGKQPEGGACGFDVESLVCEPGSACTLGLDFCGECRPAVADGAPCGANSDTPVSCGPNASCEDGTCVPRVPVGQPCTPDDRCVLGAYCGEGVCRAPNIVALGESCDQLNRCPYKSHCEAGVCVEDALLDESCADTDCASGWCSSDATCEALLPAGAACTSSLECASMLCLDGSCRDLPGPCF